MKIGKIRISIIDIIGTISFLIGLLAITGNLQFAIDGFYNVGDPEAIRGTMNYYVWHFGNIFSLVDIL
jgi:hypothetical protein